MKNNNFFPLVVAHCFWSNPNINFILPGKIISIKNMDYRIVTSILKHCDGYKSVDEIVMRVTRPNLKYEKEKIRNAIKLFSKYDILVDSSKFYKIFHYISANPMPFWKENSKEDIDEILGIESPLFKKPITVSYLESLLEKRISSRTFSAKTLPKQQIMRLIWATYGKLNRSTFFKSRVGVGTTPSAGAIYPLNIFALIIKGSKKLRRGVYKSTPNGLLFSKKLPTIKVLKKIFAGYQGYIEKSALILAITSSFERIIRKYSNRGYRYSLIEAGHAAQNAYLWCIENNLGIVEVGGFNDERLAKILSIPYPNEAPLTTLIIGRS